MMEKTSCKGMRCAIMGCSSVALEGSDPPLCEAHDREKVASVGRSYGIKASAELSNQLWDKEKHVQD